MTSKPRIKLVELEIDAHCHATEDIEKVKRAMLNLVPPELRPKVEIHAQEFKGFYGNPIVRLVAKLRGEEAEEVLRYIVSKLSDIDRRYLVDTLENRYDVSSNRVFIRLSKQDAYLGRVSLYEGSDSIRVVASFSIVRSLDEVKKYFSALAEGS